jgi:hypothetical protein
MIAEPRPVAIGSGGAGIGPLDLGRRAQLGDPAIDLRRVVRDRMARRRGEHDEQLIERAELLQIGPERRNRAPLVGQQVDHVGVEGEAAQPDGRPGHEQRGKCEHHPPAAVRPDDDGFDGRGHCRP